ncbi:uncharacterized protein LOC113334639 [Papaver somniferum]|uniref:uncharacterized protein LOC113334639 n=1 Tax=Papaver somniferum TaxID=3469 RepID=UPI000E6FFCC5|nr:uncharacterized protein LOC113334639 [Papaver somniferum]
MPAFRLTDEKEGTLRGCWKLDLDAMPVSLSYLDTSIYCKETAILDPDTTKEMDSNGVGTNPDIIAEQRHLKPSHLDHCEMKKRSQKSKKRKILEDQSTTDGGRKSTGGNSPTRFADVFHRRRAEGASGLPLGKSKTASVSDGMNRCDGSTFGSKDAAAPAKEMSLDGVDAVPGSVNEQIGIPTLPAHLKMSEIPETEFRNLKDQRSSELSFGASDQPLDKSKAATVSDRVITCDGATLGSNNATANAKKMSLNGVDDIPSSVNEQILSSPAHLKMSKIPATVFCNFDNDRSSEKLRTGQIWALFCKLDDLPKSYARIESVKHLPVFKLTIKWLEPCDPPKGVISWVDKGMPVCCGTFKVAFGEGVVFDNSISFCHQLSGVPSGNGLYTIYPRVGEVWAMYSKFCSDLKTCEYYMVEIVGVVDDCWIIVSVFLSANGFETIFKAKGRYGLSFTTIPWVELYRFSHQVPSFMLNEASYDELRGCWELDPRSMSVHIQSLN